MCEFHHGLSERRDRFVFRMSMAVSETSVVYDIKVGGCSQLNEYMKL